MRFWYAKSSAQVCMHRLSSSSIISIPPFLLPVIIVLTGSKWFSGSGLSGHIGFQWLSPFISGLHSSLTIPIREQSMKHIYIYFFSSKYSKFTTQDVFQPLPDLISCTVVTCTHLLTDNTYIWQLMIVITKCDHNTKYSVWWSLVRIVFCCFFYSGS